MFITAGGSNSAPIGDMRSDARPREVGGTTGAEGGGNDFTYVSGDQLGMLVHTI